jgi:hypothetical protein
LTAFDEMVADLLGDDDLAQEAAYWPADAATGQAVRVVVTTSRPEFGIGRGRLATDQLRAAVAAAAVARPRAGDRLVIAGVWYDVQAGPELGAGGVWQLGLVPSQDPGP